MSETETKTRKRYTGPLDISDVTDEAPVRKGEVDLSQFTAILQASEADRQAGKTEWAKGFNAPAEAATAINSRLREAARQLGLGCAVKIHAAGTAQGNRYGLTQGQVRIVVEARDKRAVKPRSENGAAKAPAAKKAAAGGLPKPPA